MKEMKLLLLLSVTIFLAGCDFNMPKIIGHEPKPGLEKEILEGSADVDESTSYIMLMAGRGEFARAKVLAESTLRHHPDDIKSYELLSKIYFFEWGLSMGGERDALVHAKHVMQLGICTVNEVDFLEYYYIGTICEGLEDWEEAKQYYIIFIDKAQKSDTHSNFVQDTVIDAKQKIDDLESGDLE